MKRIKSNFAYFVKAPCSISQMCRPHLVEDEKPFEILNSAALMDEGYECFCEDLALGRAFWETIGLPYWQQPEEFICVLIYRKIAPSTGGILAVPDENGYIGYAAFIETIEKQWLVKEA